MGIPSCRFTNKVHEEFTCTVCLDVAADPIVINDCEHIFCRKCIDGSELVKCPTCQVQFKDPKWNEMKGLNQRVYLSLEVKCLNPSCKVTSDVTTYLDHDNKCPITFEFCSDCGYKNRRGSSNAHSCSQQVRLDKLQSELDQIKKEEKKSSFSQQFRSDRQQVRFGQLENQLLEGRERFNQQQVLLEQQQVRFDQQQVRLDQLHIQLEQMNIHLAEEKERHRTELDQLEKKMTEKLNQVWKVVDYDPSGCLELVKKWQLDSRLKELTAERDEIRISDRKRTEDLIMLCVGHRDKFDGSNWYSLSNDASKLKNGYLGYGDSIWLSSRILNEIIEQYDGLPRNE